MSDLTGKKVVILATNGFEESELASPQKFLKENGAEVEVVSEDNGTIKAWNHGKWSKDYDVDRELKDARIEDYDALVLPGGVINPDKLRRNKYAVTFVKQFVESGKPVAAICHGPWMLVEADVVKGKKLTSYHAIKTDVKNAGAEYKDEEVVQDGNLITSRSPADLDAFNNKIKEVIIG